MSLETMTKLATVTVGSGGTASVTFSNIPQHYTDLVVKSSARTVDNVNDSDTLVIRFNDSTSNLSARALYGSGSSALSLTRSTNSNVAWVDTSLNTSSTFGSAEWYISNYAGNSNKTVSVDSVQENNATAAIAAISAVIWSDVSPINSITILSGNGYNLAQYSTVTLYGIKNARQTAGNSIKATGGNISFDGTYVVHTFNTSGTFTPSVPLIADYLVVAGGGGGGQAGGGAGGLRSTVTATGGGGTLETALSLTAGTSYTATVGAGGAGGTGSNGNNSVFSTITATAGGGGGSAGGGGLDGGNGGSGGGAAHQSVNNGTPGTGTANQGYAGGATGGASGQYACGAGGGAGAVGGAGNSNSSGGSGGAGGNGVSVSISGSSVTYAGGGGGGADITPGAGGTGGGGAGAIYTGVAGTENSGGGGGGGNNTAGGTGGSGIIIIRYKG